MPAYDPNQQVNEAEETTFEVRATGVVLANAGSLLSLFLAGTSSRVLRLQEVWLQNVQILPVTGRNYQFGLVRHTGHSGGTLLSTTPSAGVGGIFLHDTSDTLDADVSARIGATISGAAAEPIRSWRWSSDEVNIGTLDVESYERAVQQQTNPAWKPGPKQQPLVIRPGQGVHLLVTRLDGASDQGTFGATFVVTQV